MIFPKRTTIIKNKKLNLTRQKQKKYLKNSFFLGKKWEIYLHKLHNLSPEVSTSKKKNKVITLNKKLKSKLSPFFFKPWIKNIKLSLTKRQKYLKWLYKKTFFLKNRKDFLKTCFGEILKITHLNSHQLKGRWLSAKNLVNYEDRNRKKLDLKKLKKVPLIYRSSPENQYASLKRSMEKGWLYENLLKKNSSFNAKYFILDRPQTAFQNFYKKQKKEPWLDPLLFKRWAYSGFIERPKKETKNRKLKIKNYLRKRNPRFQKRNKLYWWRSKLLFDFYHNNRIKKDKAQRIKNVLSKIYLPFYGHLSQKQLNKIIKKKNKIKSKFLNKNETILSSLENRLDVVVYRLNLAPNILWARRLIEEGSIFLSNGFSFQTWTSIYGQLKHLSFPLKLRDPRNLYKTTYWNPNKNISHFKYLLKPIRKINYLVKPGDLIQTSRTLSINKLKNNNRAFKKPILKNWYSIKKTKFQWNNAVKAPEVNCFANWHVPKQHIKSAMFLFDPQFPDLGTNDRANELFFRWMTL